MTGPLQQNDNRAPWPADLATLVDECRYRPGWQVALRDLDRGQGSVGLTLVITTQTVDTYDPDTPIRVNHYFPVPPASYNRGSWQRWLFNQFLLVEQHECQEFFQLRDDGLIQPGDKCEVCSHQATQHDGRDSSCHYVGCRGSHRFVPAEPRFARPYAPMHGPGNDPYLIPEYHEDVARRTSFRGDVEPAGEA